MIIIDTEKNLGIELMATSLYRDDSVIHKTVPLRAIDFRCWYIHLGQAIEKYVNDNFEYDYNRPEKKCCLFHTTGKGWHLHIQVHQNTKRR